MSDTEKLGYFEEWFAKCLISDIGKKQTDLYGYAIKHPNSQLLIAKWAIESVLGGENLAEETQLFHRVVFNHSTNRFEGRVVSVKTNQSNQIEYLIGLKSRLITAHSQSITRPALFALDFLARKGIPDSGRLSDGEYTKGGKE